jgi:two-component system, OmpR family, alkaline phosphatase synthesis response regulator PhoP
MTAILIVDDEQSIHNVTTAYLKAEGYTVHSALDGTQALAAFRRYMPELVILDVMLPGMDGFEVLQHIRRESDVYVLMLTARSEETDRVVGLTIGADDYLTKPFSPRELVARVKAILRRGRNRSPNGQSILSFAHIRLDGQRYRAWRDEQDVELTTLEFRLLQALAMVPGTVLSREQLLQKVWGYDFYGDERVVDVHIGHIRQKLEYEPSNSQFIITVRGVGYKFEDDPL